jgi:hypothetical protein
VEFRLRAECGIQAEKVVAQAERQAESKNHQFNTKSAVFSSQNHYNKALNRCLVLITSGNRENYGMITEVLDAFEHSRLLVCSGDLHTGAKKACQGEATYTTPTWLTLLTPPEVPISEALSRISSYFRD